jgi:hypothetical protein
MTSYTNLPADRSQNDTEKTLQIFNTYFDQPITVKNNDLVALTGFFESKGFGKAAADTAASAIITQAYRDSYDVMQVLDSLKGLESVELSGLVSEIINFNRLKTSLLGVAQSSAPSIEVTRSILP